MPLWHKWLCVKTKHAIIEKRLYDKKVACNSCGLQDPGHQQSYSCGFVVCQAPRPLRALHSLLAMMVISKCPWVNFYWNVWQNDCLMLRVIITMCGNIIVFLHWFMKVFFGMRGNIIVCGNFLTWHLAPDFVVDATLKIIFHFKVVNSKLYNFFMSHLIAKINSFNTFRLNLQNIFPPEFEISQFLGWIKSARRSRADFIRPKNCEISNSGGNI